MFLKSTNIFQIVHPIFLNILRLISIFAILNTVFKQRVMSTQNFIIARWSVSTADVVFLWFHTEFFLHCFLKICWNTMMTSRVKEDTRDKTQVYKSVFLFPVYWKFLSRREIALLGVLAMQNIDIGRLLWWYLHIQGIFTDCIFNFHVFKWFTNFNVIKKNPIKTWDQFCFDKLFFFAWIVWIYSRILVV